MSSAKVSNVQRLATCAAPSNAGTIHLETALCSLLVTIRYSCRRYFYTLVLLYIGVAAIHRVPSGLAENAKQSYRVRWNFGGRILD